ncbi:hypothetical protein GGS26DRAFT_403470 [Hypomontagnella submonticulosa]|nr:hypothetical protein GGS26DRAFT_403470 [Hypomontagnella submonticulosa]
MNMHFHPQASFGPAYHFPQGNGIPYAESQYAVHPNFNGIQYMYAYQQPRAHHLIADRNALVETKTESKPRLSKEEVEKLEKVFKENPKPSSSTKAQLADGLGLDRPRINNWFQNRRAKAKQERKQEEYEARRAAEKAGSEPVSPEEGPSSGASDQGVESVRRRVQPSSALFPDISSTSQTIDDAFDNEDDGSADSDSEDSPVTEDHPESLQDEISRGFQSPLSLNFSHADTAEFTRTHAHQNYSTGNAGSFASFIPQQSVECVGQDEQLTGLNNSLPSPNEQGTTNEHCGRRYSTMMDTDFSSATTTPFLQSQSAFATPSLTESPMESIQGHMEGANTPINQGQSTALVRQGIPTPTDSFKSPPPPANIASRRNIPRPATIQTSGSRSMSYNLGYGHKTALDVSKRLDPSSPATAMRRIASTNGSMHGRIQKPSSGPRSPFYNRNAEALLQQYSRSPMSAVTTTFAGTAPPTPMTPAIIDQQGAREPVVSCADDGSFLLGGSISASIMQELKAESNLKTPPTTPGMLTQFGCHNYNSFGDFHADQPLLTPFFQTDFPDLNNISHVSSYTELNDGSLPTTPLYPNMMGSIQEQNTYGHNTGNTQFDWESNESVNSSKSSPHQPRSKQIQFTQNMTPQDYTSLQEK